MANTISALKRMRHDERRTAINIMRRSRLRHAVRALRRLLEKNDVTGAQAALPKTFAVIDRAAKWGIIKKNTAARYKSKLALRINSLASA